MNPSDPSNLGSENNKRYQDLRHKVLDQTAGLSERIEFEALVLSSHELKADFAEYLHQESSLLIRGDLREPIAATAPDSPLVADRRVIRNSRRRQLGLMALAAATLVAVTLGTADYLVGNPRPALVISSAKNCLWGLTTSATTPGKPLAPGRFILNSGIAVMKLPLVDLTIEGPTDIEVISSKRCMVRSGKVFATVHPGGEGFIVETPTSVLIDRGTVFAVNVSPWGDSDLTVVKGVVDAAHRTTGESRSVGVKGGLRLTSKGVETIHDTAEVGPMGLRAGDIPSYSRQP